MPDLPVRYLHSPLLSAVEPDNAEAAGNSSRGAIA